MSKAQANETNLGAKNHQQFYYVIDHVQYPCFWWNQQVHVRACSSQQSDTVLNQMIQFAFSDLMYRVFQKDLNDLNLVYFTY